MVRLLKMLCSVPCSQTKLLKKADSLLVEEAQRQIEERETTLKEKAPPLKLSGLSVQELQVGGQSQTLVGKHAPVQQGDLTVVNRSKQDVRNNIYLETMLIKAPSNLPNDSFTADRQSPV